VVYSTRQSNLFGLLCKREGKYWCCLFQYGHILPPSFLLGRFDFSALSMTVNERRLHPISGTSWRRPCNDQLGLKLGR
jgi:hypothetical protein